MYMVGEEMYLRFPRAQIGSGLFLWWVSVPDYSLIYTRIDTQIHASVVTGGLSLLK